MEEVISHYKVVNGDEGFGEWEVDQVDSTDIQLNSICCLYSVPGLYLDFLVLIFVSFVSDNSLQCHFET